MLLEPTRSHLLSLRDALRCGDVVSLLMNAIGSGGAGELRRHLFERNKGADSSVTTEDEWNLMVSLTPVASILPPRATAATSCSLARALSRCALVRHVSGTDYADPAVSQFSSPFAPLRIVALKAKSHEDSFVRPIRDAPLATALARAK